MTCEYHPHLFRLERIAERVEKGQRPPGMKVVEKGETPRNDVLKDFAGTRHLRSHVAYSLKGGDIVLRGKSGSLGVGMRPMSPRESRR